METVISDVDRDVDRPWLFGATVASLFVGLFGVWQFMLLFVFLRSPGEDFSILWDILQEEWGVYLTHGVIAVVAAVLLRRMYAIGATHEAWSVIWRAAVAFPLVWLVITLCVSFGTSLIHDRPLFFLGFEVL